MTLLYSLKDYYGRIPREFAVKDDYVFAKIDANFDYLESLIGTSFLIDVGQYGAVGDYNPNTGVGTDDSAAIQAALNAAATAGGGIVFLDKLKYKLGSAITVPINVALMGQNASGQDGWRNLGTTAWTNPAISPTAVGGSLMRDFTSTLWCCFDAGVGDGTGTYNVTDASALPNADVLTRTAAIYVRGMLQNVNVFQASFNNSLAATYTDNATWNSQWNSGFMSGLAIKCDADYAMVQGCFIGGFMQAIACATMNGMKIANILMDCMNGLEFANCYDSVNVDNVQANLFSGVGYSLTSLVRRGTFIYAHGTVDGPRFSNCFTFGHKHGIYFKSGVNFCQISNFAADSSGAETAAYYGVRMDTGVVYTTMSNVFASNRQYGVYSDIGAGNQAIISGYTSVGCNNSAYVNSGSLTVVAGNLIAPAAGVKLGVTNAGSGTVRVYNPVFSSMTSNTVGHVVIDLEENVDVKNFSATGDGTTDDAVGLAAAFAAAVTLGRAVYIPSGKYLCSTSLATSNVSMSVYGDGVNLSKLVFTGSTGGLQFTLRAQGAGRRPDQLSVQNLTIETNATNLTNPAIHANYSSYQANAQGSVWINNVNITRKDDGTGTWAAGIRLTNCFLASLSSISIVGDDRRFSIVAYDFIDCVDVKLVNCTANRYQYGALGRVAVAPGGNTEGVIFTACNFYDVGRGLDFTKAIHLITQGCHYNINDGTASSTFTATITGQNTVTASAGTPFANLIAASAGPPAFSGSYIAFQGLAVGANNRLALPVASIGGGGSSVTFAGTPFTNEAGTVGVTFTLCATTAIYWEQVLQGFITNNLIYSGGSAGDALSQDAVMLNISSANTVNGTLFVGATKANTRYGIRIQGGGVDNTLDNNIISFLTTGISTNNAGDTGNHFTNNVFSNNTANITEGVALTNYVSNNTTTASTTLINQMRLPATSSGPPTATGWIGGGANVGTQLWPFAGSIFDFGLCDAAGNVVAASFGNTFKVRHFTVATLPAAAAGIIDAKAFVTDSNATLAAGLGNVVAGGGANYTPVYCDGTNWRIG